MQEMTIESYKYASLAAATGAAPEDRSDGDRGGARRAVIKARRVVRGQWTRWHYARRCLQVDWSCNIGEHALALRLVRFSAALPATGIDLVVLGAVVVVVVVCVCGGVWGACRVVMRAWLRRAHNFLPA